MLEVFRKFGSIQFDPIAVAGRNHDLVLHARVAGYEPAWCDLLYERREIFETTNKALSLIPASEFPWFRLGFGRKGPRFHAAILAENAAVAERVLGRIRAEGALSALDFEPEHGAPKDWFGMPENVVRAVLEAYTVTGVIGLARREGNRRYYDLLERLLPAELLAHEVPVREQLRHKLLSRYRAHGLLGAGGAGGTFDRIANPESTPERPGRNELREELVELGRSCPSTSRACAASASSWPRNSHCCRRRRSRRPPSRSSPRSTRYCGTTLSSRACSASDYVWEGFFPPAKRRWGWYVLPISFRDRFVGRIEPRIDRDRARVEVLGVWWEDGFAPRRADGFVDAMRDALGAYLRSRARAAWSGHPTSQRRSGSCSPARDRDEWRTSMRAGGLATLAACRMTTVRPAGSRATCSTSWWPSSPGKASAFSARGSWP